MIKNLILMAMLCASSAYGTMIDAAHWNYNDPPPAVMTDFFQHENRDIRFLDSMWSIPYTINGKTYQPGWVSQFGSMPGGTLFQCHIDLTGPTPSTTILWNFVGTPYFLAGVYVDGNGMSNLYTGWEKSGSLTIMLDGLTDIWQVSFYGNIPGVPDGGSTLMMMGVTTAGLFGCRRRSLRRAGRKLAKKRWGK